MQVIACPIDAGAGVVREDVKLTLPLLPHLRLEIRTTDKILATCNDGFERRAETCWYEHANRSLSPGKHGPVELGSGDLQIDLGLRAERDAATRTSEIHV